MPERIQIPVENRTNEPIRRDEPARDELVPTNVDGLTGVKQSERYDDMARDLLNDGGDKLAEKLIEESRSHSTDKLAENLIDKDKSIAQSNIDRSIRRADRAVEDQTRKDQFNSKGDVYITRDCYQAMREAGNSYTRAHLDPNRELERTLERFDLDRAEDKERSINEATAQGADKTQGNSDSLPDLFNVNTNSNEIQPDQSSESADVTGSMTVFEPADKDDFKAGDDGTRDREDEQNRDFPSSRG